MVTQMVSGASPAPSNGSAAAAARLPAVDVFRGVAILAVVLHHLTGLALRHTGGGSVLHETLAVVNRTLHFVVPAFVFITALVLTRSAMRRLELRRYYADRARTALLPYLLWTVLYVGFRVFTHQDPRAVLDDPQRWEVWFRYGKGYFHLYFLLIVLQFYLVLPLLLPLWRRRTPLPFVLLGALALQVGVYALNHAGALDFRFPATMAVWYVLPIVLGMHFGAHSEAFEAFWRRAWPWCLAAAAFGLAWYLPVSLARLDGLPVNSFAYSASNWVYTTAMTLALFGVSHWLAAPRAWVRAPLAYLGTVSLQVYLLHPALLFYLERQGFPGQTWAFLLTLAAYALVAVGGPIVVARGVQGTFVSRWLFGR